MGEEHFGVEVGVGEDGCFYGKGRERNFYLVACGHRLYTELVLFHDKERESLSVSMHLCSDTCAVDWILRGFIFNINTLLGIL